MLPNPENVHNIFFLISNHERFTDQWQIIKEELFDSHEIVIALDIRSRLSALPASDEGWGGWQADVSLVASTHRVHIFGMGKISDIGGEAVSWQERRWGRLILSFKLQLSLQALLRSRVLTGGQMPFFFLYVYKKKKNTTSLLRFCRYP